MSSTKLSFEERMHRGVLTAQGPAEALNEAIAAIEADIALSGALFYSFDHAGRLVARAGSLREPFSADVSWFEDDPCQERGREVVDTPLVHATRLLSRRALVDSTAYREFYVKHGIDHIVCLRVNDRKHSSRGMTGVFLGRREDHGDFAIADKRRLLGVLPALSALHHLQERQERMRRVLEGLATATDDAGALFVVTSAGDILWRSEAVRDLLLQSPRSRALDLVPLLQDALAELESSGRTRKILPVHLGAGQALWSLELTPLAASGPEPLYLARLRPARDAEAELADHFGLTPTEAAVLACLGEGMSNAELAEALSIATNTAATHVKRVLAKMRVASRLQAGLLMQRARLLNDAGRAWRG